MSRRDTAAEKRRALERENANLKIADERLRGRIQFAERQLEDARATLDKESRRADRLRRDIDMLLSENTLLRDCLRQLQGLSRQALGTGQWQPSWGKDDG